VLIDKNYIERHCMMDVVPHLPHIKLSSQSPCVLPQKYDVTRYPIIFGDHKSYNGLLADSKINQYEIK